MNVSETDDKRHNFYHVQRITGKRQDVHFINARFRQRFARLSVPPKSVVKWVESMSRMSPARCSVGGIHSRQLNSLFPAAVKGCGRSGSISCRAKTCTDLASWAVTS